MESEMGYIVVNGPEKLEKVLNELLEHSKLDLTIRERAHYILFEMGNQKSLIKMDLNIWPIVFWYYDLLGRPATSLVKDVLARFIWDKGGEKEWYFKEKGIAFSSQAKEEEDVFSEWRKNVFEAKHEKD